MDGSLSFYEYISFCLKVAILLGIEEKDIPENP